MEPAKAEEIKQNAEQFNKELAHDEAHTNIYKFRPNTSPNEKASIAKNADLDRHTSAGKRVITDISDSSESKVDPTQIAEQSIPKSPAAAAAAAPPKPVEFPKWYRVGWKQVANPGSKEAGIEVYDSVLKELYYSNLWENSAVVFVSFFATWFIAYFGFSIVWLTVILAFVGRLVQTDEL